MGCGIPFTVLFVCFVGFVFVVCLFVFLRIIFKLTSNQKMEKKTLYYFYFFVSIDLLSGIMPYELKEIPVLVSSYT